MNDHSTGEHSTCTKCHRRIEHGLVLVGYQGGQGTPLWRTPDRGHACARCPADGQFHTPGHITMGPPT